MGLANVIARNADRSTSSMLKGTESLGDGAGKVGSKIISATVAATPGVTIAAASTYFAADHVLPALQSAISAPSDPHYTVDVNKAANVGLDALGVVACGFGVALGASMAVRGAAKAFSSKATAAIDG